MRNNKTPAEIRASSPFPWRYLTMGVGRVVCVDSANREVPIFDMLQVVCQHTAEVVRSEAPASSS